MKVKITAYVHYLQWSWEETGTYQLFSCKLDDDDHRTFVCEQEVEVDVPEKYDPRAQKIAALEKQKQEVMSKYQAMVTEINNRISNLQALEYTA